jgi:hypothetical protein
LPDDLPPGVRPPGHRVDMRCDSCGLFDRHPRHITVLDMERGIAVARHFDCCHHAGCAGGSCTAALNASGNAHGDELVAFLEARQPRG